MPDLADMTSPVRVALAREITLVARQDPEKRARLEVDLGVAGYEQMTTADLIGMARVYGVAPERIEAITATRSAEMSVVRASFLCRVCSDERLVGNDIDGWLPCPNCNIVPADVVFDPTRC